MILVSFDLAGAEWVVTAYLANDERMIAVANGDESPHVITGSLISGAPTELVKAESKLVGNETDPTQVELLREPLREQLQEFFLPRTMSIRQAGKKSNHGLNYRMQYKRFALENEMPETDAREIVRKYTREAYPGLSKTFWPWVDACLRKNRTLENCLGRKVKLRDAWGPDLQNAATAFVPQSTVFDVCRLGMCRAYDDRSRDFEPAMLLLQVHDSLDYQYPLDYLRLAHFILVMVERHMRVALTYNGHRFELKVDVKVGFNKGHMVPVETAGRGHSELAKTLREVLEPLAEPLCDAPCN